MSKFLKKIKISSTWDNFIDSKTMCQLEKIESKVGDNINPTYEKVLRFLELDLNNIKVVILGQDPYPQRGVATGRAFEVDGLNDWSQKFRQVSLKNIIRLLYKTYNNVDVYDKNNSYLNICCNIVNQQFKLLPPNKLFKSWERQGVLLLNTYFTCEVGNPGSHKDLWIDFTNDLLKYISTKNKEIIWFLWGNNAIQFKHNILFSKKIYQSRHPMMCSEKYNDDFLKSKCFEETRNLVNWLG